MPDARVLPSIVDPAEAAVAKESVRLAFMAALQQLPPKQRAVLILREVLAWRANEVAELLDTSVASVNSALQRARATLAERDEKAADAAVSDPLDEEQQKLLERYVAAFEGYDMAALTALLHEDAIMTMPPFDLWLTGHDDITGFMTTIGAACEGSRLIPVQVNGLPGFAQYKPDPEAGGFSPWSVQVLEISDGRLTGFHFFLDTKRWFPLFDLPLHLEAESDQVEEGPPGGQLESRQEVDGPEPRRAGPHDLDQDHSATGRRQQRPHLVAQLRLLVTGDGAGRHEYCGCHGVHDR
jgi:RNA polymerase sigma-70 factor (ECF subfamily)